MMLQETQTAPDLPQLPELPHYKLVEEIGVGGMGKVYRAVHKTTQDTFAIKALQLQDKTTDESSEIRGRFQREAHLAMGFDHPQLVKVFDCFSHKDQDYLVMEYLKGTTLKDYLSGRLIRSGRHVIPFIIQVCQGLTYAHRQGVVHRDIKPDNLFVTQNNVLKIMDFGIARQSNADEFLTQTQPGMMLGTLNYMSPEQLQDTANIDPRTDIFSLGVVMYELFTGKQPFTCESMGQTMLNILSQDPPSPETLNPRLPANLVKVIQTCLSKRRGQRYQSADELANALQEVATTNKENNTLPALSLDLDTASPAKTAAIKSQSTQATPVNYQDILPSGKDLLPRKYYDRASGLCLSCTADGLKATLSCDPTYASETLTSQPIYRLLDEAGVKYGVDEQCIAELCVQSYFDDVCIAKGQPAQPGQDAYLAYLWTAPVPGPRLQNDGSVNHRELSQVISVRAGDAVARKHLAQEGSVGNTIYGVTLPVSPVKDFALKENLGTIFHSEDKHVLVANTSGSPVQLHQGVQVLNTLEVQDVNLRTGNVRFEGTVIVHGNIEKGFAVHAGGDLVVYGSVESSYLSSERNMYLHQPVYSGSHLKAKYHIYSQFLQGVDLECGGDLHVETGLLHSQVRATGKVTMGAQGHINGGEVYSTYQIQCHRIGSHVGHQTRIAVGQHPGTQLELEKVQEKQFALQQKLQNNIKDMLYARTHKQTTRIKALEDLRTTFLFEVNTINDEVLFLQAQLKHSEKPEACAIYADHLGGDVHSNLCGSGRVFREPLEGPLRLRQVAKGLRHYEVELSYGAAVPE